MLTLSGKTSVGAGVVVETFSGGTAVVAGTLTNGGTLFASGSGSLIEIVSGAVVNGGVAEVGDGLVAILGSSSENVNFLSTGSGGLAIADTSGHATAFKGRVSGFGGTAHANKNQFIDLVSVTSAPDTINLSYASAASHTSGTLFVSSGGVQVAAITMVGHYSAGNFVITSGAGGTVEITDPTVPNGGSVEVGARPDTSAARHRFAEYRFRRADHACLFGEHCRHRRRADGWRRPPRRHRRAPWQLHGRKLRPRGRRPWRHAGYQRRPDRAADPRASAHVNAELLASGTTKCRAILKAFGTRSLPQRRWRRPLAPTLSPQAGRGSRQVGLRSKNATRRGQTMVGRFEIPSPRLRGEGRMTGLRCMRGASATKMPRLHEGAVRDPGQPCGGCVNSGGCCVCAWLISVPPWPSAAVTKLPAM